MISGIEQRVLQSWTVLRAFARGVVQELEAQRAALKSAQAWFHHCRSNHDNNLYNARVALYDSLDAVWRAQTLANEFFDHLHELNSAFRVQREADGTLTIYPEPGQRYRPIKVRT